MAEDVRVEVSDRIGIITMNRPDARNAVNTSMSKGVAAAVDDLVARDDVTVIILTGAGGTFCAGMDLKAFAGGERPAIPGRGLAGITEAGVGKPLIAAVEGYALAGGFELALAADIIVASRTAVFGFPEVARGLVASGGGLLRIAKVMPLGAAMDVVLTGSRFDAEAAHGYGLVTRLTEPGDALAGAVALGRQIAANAPLAVRLSKEILAGAVRWVDPEMYAWQRSVAEPSFTSEDAKEGVRAFAEKRPPVWTGR